ETLRARKVRNQVKEVKVKLIVYNINKKVIQLLWIKLRISTEPLFVLFLKPLPNGFSRLNLNCQYKFPFKGIFKKLGYCKKLDINSSISLFLYNIIHIYM
ncbi:MAG: hypothetical protein ACOX7X_10700, partial [Methanosarcina flavescens]